MASRKVPSIEYEFLSTLSLRRATLSITSIWIDLPISIHALLAESDCMQRKHKVSTVDFYPRSPCGERLCHHINKNAAIGFLSTLSLRRATWASLTPTPTKKFLSTLSLRRATVLDEKHDKVTWISIHALLAESDWNSRQATVHTWKFLSTLSLRRATCPIISLLIIPLFLSTLSLRRATISTALSIQPTRFLSTLSLRRATRGRYCLRHSA